VGDGEELLTYLNSALKVLLGLDIFPRVPKKKLNFVVQCYTRKNCCGVAVYVPRSFAIALTLNSATLATSASA